MAVAAIVNPISTGSAGLGMSEASSAKGALQLCPSRWTRAVVLNRGWVEDAGLAPCLCVMPSSMLLWGLEQYTL